MIVEFHGEAGEKTYLLSIGGPSEYLCTTYNIFEDFPSFVESYSVLSCEVATLKLFA